MTAPVMTMPNMDSNAFRAGMRQLVGGVTAVATCLDGKRTGLTATAVCSVSADPPRLLVCVNCQGETYQMIGESRVLSINILSTEHESLAKRFAGMGLEDGGDRFEEGDWQPGITGAPVLSSALASFDCRVGMIMDTGSHGVVIADIQNVIVRAGASPLLYSDGQFTTTL